MQICSDDQKVLNKNIANGFALPTVLIASFIMLAVLVVSVASTAAIKVALVNQYYDQLAKNASDAGSAYARACLMKDNGYPKWTDEKPLKPNTDCSGTETLSCPDNSTNVLCAVTISGNIRSTFSVPKPEIDVYGRALDVESNGYTKLLRTSDGSVWRQYLRNSRLDKRINSTLDSQKKILVISSAVVDTYTHNCSIDSSNLAYCWGYNTYGQLGNNATYGGITANPTAVYTGGVLSGKTFKYIQPAGGSGASFTCAIASDDLAYCWGNTDSGSAHYHLGRGTSSDSTSPVAVSTAGVLSGKTIKSMSVGGHHTCVIASDDNAYCWGDASYGALGKGNGTSTNVPVAVSKAGVLSGKTIKKISSGGYQTCAVASDDKAYCWGYNSNGQIGDGTKNSALSPVAVSTSGVLSGKTIVDIATGWGSSCAIDSSGKAYCWGSNYSGQLGDNSTTERLLPVSVDISGVLSGKTLAKISVGLPHACAVDLNGKAYCWGANGVGQLGNGSTGTYSLNPVAVTGPISSMSIKSIVAGVYSTCAVTTEDYAFCWGANTANTIDESSVSNSRTSSSPSPALPPWRDDFVSY